LNLELGASVVSNSSRAKRGNNKPKIRAGHKRKRIWGREANGGNDGKP
jgi:hypothetical protein